MGWVEPQRERCLLTWTPSLNEKELSIMFNLELRGSACYSSS